MNQFFTIILTDYVLLQALMEPSKKRLKLDSPGEARNNG